MFSRIHVTLGVNPQIKYLLSDPWMLLSLQPDTGREDGVSVCAGRHSKEASKGAVESEGKKRKPFLT